MPSQNDECVMEEGDGDIASEDEFEPQCNISRCPSFANSCVDVGFTLEEAKQEVFQQPRWAGMQCSDGSWEQPTRGDGEREEAEEQDANKIHANGPSGHFGVLAANWGG